MCKQFNIYLVKHIVWLLNLVLAISVLTLMYISISSYLNFKLYQHVLDSAIQTYPKYGMILSIIALAVLMFGALGICLDAFGMLFLATIMLILVGGISACLGLLTMTDLTAILADQNYYYDHLDQSENLTQRADAMISIDAIQLNHYCCGFTGGKYMYWNESTHLPASCCKDPSTGVCNGGDVWSRDCLTALAVYGVLVHSHIAVLFLWVGSGAIILGSMQWVLSMAIRQYYYY